MNTETSLFFVALLPPLDIQDYATQIKQYFATQYHSRAALKSPPHITLQPPFRWLNANTPASALEECLQEFARDRASIPITLNGFAAFPPRVIYIDVVRSAELLALQADLMAQLAAKLGIVDRVSKTRPFAPHMTVGFKDLSRQNFRLAWQEFQPRQLYFEFTASCLTLLRHDGKKWQIQSEFGFGGNG
ncbi:MAG: RNA 2',3'-cyclic phosphodiesterase [Chroococcidiopsis cubana SAG 39.79]|uniref:2'-5' RNA ligase n=1 Tax=Chroococcidiopsis cubana SAG 39.79 TaxID=388085 RepID=A0AB37UKU6_9CYAN|nr:2'-5' RNA ligase family protein [Chroococcidiopsis cubana]MDZ4875828.1 RNA 2',3'-cyclic phosphodiesterase [Chroococcidiopsis cubana SAG 39.79]PSB56329.1 2'-5' RNA ligase [Chroococcidiopsis cubana CCALA 043]RUT12008.1 2'-5' RNA ligase [Chroococcidiopsis cubana SAG 39.79]